MFARWRSECFSSNKIGRLGNIPAAFKLLTSVLHLTNTNQQVPHLHNQTLHLAVEFADAVFMAIFLVGVHVGLGVAGCGETLRLALSRFLGVE